MREIPLTQGKVALVDDEDYDFLNQWKWHILNARGLEYAVRSIWRGVVNGKERNDTVLMHREIMATPAYLHTDHINRNGLDNRKSNLRVVTNRENAWNLKNQGKYIGVTKPKNKNTYRASIRIDGIWTYLGYFKTPEEAHDKYMEVAIKLINGER